MKKILCTLICVAALFSLVACSSGDGSSTNADGLIEYSESGLNFALPEEMELHNVTYADICYGDGTCEFFVYFYSRDTLLTDLFLSKDSTAEEYADWFVEANEYEGVSKTVDKSGKKVELSYVYEPENTYYVDVIFRNSDSLIHVTLCCPNEQISEYLPKYDLWKGYLSLMYPDVV